MANIPKILFLDEDNTLFLSLSDKVKTDKIKLSILHQNTLRGMLSNTIVWESVDIILIDISLPNLDVKSFVEAVKRHFFPADVGIILLGTPAQNTEIEQGLKLGAHHFLYKELVSDTLILENIQKLLANINSQEKYQFEIKKLLQNNNEIIEYRKYLDQQLSDRTKELQEVYEELLKEMTAHRDLEEQFNTSVKELDTFVYRASHDLRGPIASLIGLSNLAKVEIQDENAQRYLGMIAENSEKLNRILITLLDVTRIKYLDVEITEIDCNELATKVKQQFSKDFMRENIDFQMEINTPDLFVSDRYLIRTIIQNLIDNAISFANKTSKKNILFKITQQENKDIQIIVSDNGQGIEKNAQDKVFTMFFKHNAMSKGSGVGLYVVKNCLQKLKGNVTLQSQINVGTEVIIILPNLNELASC